MNLRSQLITWLTFVACALTCLPTAWAQEYDEATIQAVNKHFEDGAQLYYDGKYDDAIGEFRAAHAQIPNAIFLYNISLAQAKKGDLDASLRTAEEAQEFGGLGPDEQVQNDARIVSLRSVAAAEQTAVEVKRGSVTPLLNFSTLGWVGTGVAVLGIVGLGAVAILDQNLASDVEAHKAAVSSGNQAEANSIADELRPRQTGARTLFVFSAVAVAAGAGLLVYDILAQDEGGVALVPMRDGMAVSFTHRF